VGKTTIFLPNVPFLDRPTLIIFARLDEIFLIIAWGIYRTIFNKNITQNGPLVTLKQKVN